jgi:lipopolysaccharide biosynthesis protein
MTKPLPKWLFIRYAMLWSQKGNVEFDYDEARRLLKERDDRTLSVVLSDLRKYGWLETTLNQNDARKRVYRLKHPQVAAVEVAKELKS